MDGPGNVRAEFDLGLFWQFTIAQHFGEPVPLCVVTIVFDCVIEFLVGRVVHVELGDVVGSPAAASA